MRVSGFILSRGNSMASAHAAEQPVCGLLFCEKYAEQQEAEERFLYVGINMHWEKHSLALPRLPKESRWKILLSHQEDRRRMEKKLWKIFAK